MHAASNIGYSPAQPLLSSLPHAVTSWLTHRAQQRPGWVQRCKGVLACCFGAFEEARQACRVYKEAEAKNRDAAIEQLCSRHPRIPQLMLSTAVNRLADAFWFDSEIKGAIGRAVTELSLQMSVARTSWLTRCNAAMTRAALGCLAPHKFTPDEQGRLISSAIRSACVELMNTPADELLRRDLPSYVSRVTQWHMARVMAGHLDQKVAESRSIVLDVERQVRSYVASGLPRLHWLDSSAAEKLQRAVVDDVFCKLLTPGHTFNLEPEALKGTLVRITRDSFWEQVANAWQVRLVNTIQSETRQRFQQDPDAQQREYSRIVEAQAESGAPVDLTQDPEYVAVDLVRAFFTPQPSEGRSTRWRVGRLPGADERLPRPVERIVSFPQMTAAQRLDEMLRR